MVVLGLLCTAAAFVIFAGLVAEVGAGRATVITYVAPVVAVALGIAVLGERPGPGPVAGLLLILAGSWLSTDGRMPPGAAALAARCARGVGRKAGRRRARRSKRRSADRPPGWRFGARHPEPGSSRPSAQVFGAVTGLHRTGRPPGSPTK